MVSANVVIAVCHTIALIVLCVVHCMHKGVYCACHDNEVTCDSLTGAVYNAVHKVFISREVITVVWLVTVKLYVK